MKNDIQTHKGLEDLKPETREAIHRLAQIDDDVLPFFAPVENSLIMACRQIIHDENVNKNGLVV